MRGKADPANIPVLLLAALATLVLGKPCLRAQSPQGADHPLRKLPSDDTPREIIYPYYSLREGFDSKLEMMDRAPRPFDFTVAVHGKSGQTLQTKPMTIQPAEELVLDCRKILEDLGADTRGDFAEGSVSLLFKGKGNPLGGRMIVSGKEVSWNLGPVWREGESGQSMIPKTLDTFWWELGGTRDAEIKVDNVTGENVSADLFLDVQGKRHAAPLLHFLPYEMKDISITQVLGQMGLTAYQAPYGGLSIVAHTPKPALVAQGTLTDSETGRMTGLSFPLPQLQFVSALHTTAVPISVPRLDSPFVGTGNFIPHIFLRNLSSSEQTVTVTIEYPGETDPRQTVLDPIRIDGYTTQDIRLDSFYYRLPLPLPYVAIRIQYNGSPGSLIGQVTTVEQNTGKVELMGVRNEADGYAASLASYWSFDEKNDFYIFYTNMGEKVARVGIQVYAGGVEYFVPPVKLKPHETIHVNLRELRDKQQPDVQGHTIPPDAAEGRLFYNRMDNVPMMGCVLDLPRRD